MDNIRLSFAGLTHKLADRPAISPYIPPDRKLAYRNLQHPVSHSANTPVIVATIKKYAAIENEAARGILTHSLILVYPDLSCPMNDDKYN
jgi:hypothetical protein